MTNPSPPGCYVCGSAELAADADPRNPTCDRCKPAREHVVSMQTGVGESLLAICPCGWRNESTGADRHAARDAAVVAHWRSEIAAAAAGGAS